MNILRIQRSVGRTVSAFARCCSSHNQNDGRVRLSIATPFRCALVGNGPISAPVGLTLRRSCSGGGLLLGRLWRVHG